MSQTSPAAEPQPSLELAHYLRVLAKKSWIVLLCAVLGVLAAFAYLTTVERTVTATTSVDVNLITNDPFSTMKAPAELIDAATEVQTATSSAVLGEVAATLGGVKPSQVRANTDAELIPDATIMRISYTAGSTKDAEAGADAVAKAYLDNRSQQASARVSRIVDNLTQRRDALRDDLVRLNSITAAAQPGSPRAVQAESDRQLVNIELDSLSTQISSFVGLETTGGRVLSRAEENPTTVTPSRPRVMAGGLVGGVLLGVVAAFMVAALDRRVRDERDLRRLGVGPVIGETLGPSPGIPAQGAELDAFRAVRERLLAMLPDKATGLTVIDLRRGSRLPTVAVDLAQVLSELDMRIDLVIPHPDEDVVADIAAAAQLPRVTGGLAGTERYGRKGSPMTMTVPPAGRLLAHGAGPGADIGESDLAVVAVQSGAPASAVLGAARLEPVVLLVITPGRTSRSAVARLNEELNAVGARVYGTIVAPRRRPFRSR